MRNVPASSSGNEATMTAAVATSAPATPSTYPATGPNRRPRRTITQERDTAPAAAPRTTAAPGAPLHALDPAMSLAAIVATVAAAIWPVLPSATPATSAQTVRRR